IELVNGLNICQIEAGRSSRILSIRINATSSGVMKCHLEFLLCGAPEPVSGVVTFGGDNLSLW
ncbi:hypothetical protein, partial [Enterobacter hormaechei]|uniref:hypothetical protein n=1 Tax=Enterobacter hormaechei TaxID=158836 RepID=UPI00195412D8